MDASKYLTIREGTVGDLAGILLIVRSLPEFFVDAAAHLIEADARIHHSLVAERDGTLVGFVIWSLDGCDVCELLWIGVACGARNTGIGKAMVQECLRRAEHSKRIFLRTATPDSTIPSTLFDGSKFAHTIAFFKANGFVQQQVLRGYWGPTNHCLCMTYRRNES